MIFARFNTPNRKASYVQERELEGNMNLKSTEWKHNRRKCEDTKQATIMN